MNRITKRLLLAVSMLGVVFATMAVAKVDTYAAAGTTVVYASTANTDYHSDGCKNLGTDKVPVALSDAVALGFTQCKTCKAPALDVAKASAGTAAPTGNMVWLSATGEKYHNKNNCGKMNPAKARQVTVEEAKAKGKTACKKCFK